MTEKEYRTYPAISRSELWHIRESPEKFKYYRDNPQPPTPALLFGQVVHKLLLQPEDYDNEFAVAPDIDRRTKDGKAAYSDFLAAAEGKTIVSLAQYEIAAQMAKKALSEPYVAKLLNGRREVPFFWTDEDTGEACKVRVDCLTEMEGDGIPTIIDYKSASSADTNVFNRDIFKYGYHFQAGMYSEGVMRAMGLTEHPKFTFIVQEKKPPYSVNVIEVPEEVMQYGLDTFRELIGIYHTCKETGYWYGYMGPLDKPNEAYLPGWYTMGDDNDDDEEDTNDT